jgi:signal transduction histidine kinase/ActR/RegA family two-component response regulator
MTSKANDPEAELDAAPRRYRKLGPRLVFATLVALSLGLVATSVHTVLSERASLSEQLDARGESLVRVAAPACVEFILADDIPYLQTFVEGVARARTDIVFARIERVDGQTVCESSNDVQWRKHGAQRVKKYESDILAPADEDARQRVLGRVILGIATTSLDELQASRSRDLMFQAAASFVALALALSFFLRRAVIRPISELDRQATALARGDLDSPLSLETGDEIARLAETLDGMRQNLRGSYHELRTSNAELQRVGEIRDRALLDLERALTRANEASEAKTMFLATMSHELRTPMNGVIGSTSLLLQTPLDPDQREFVETVRTSAESLRLLVDDLLDFSKLESGKVALQTSETDLRGLVHEVVTSLQSRAQDKGLALREYVDAEVPARVRADGLRVRQLLHHLLGNAIKFTDEGNVTIKVGLDRRDDGCATVRVAVVDTGIGVPKAAHASLFEPFTQADGSLSRRHGGTGLGLAICQRLVALMRGTIGFESAPGSGSVFWFTLPVEEVLDRLREVPRPPLPAQANKVTMRKHAPILLVEDNPVNQRMALHMLRRGGYDAELAENGQVALDKLAKTRFMLVLMDCSMPVMDGFETTRRIRASETATGEHLPIVALTANAMPGDRERCLAAGMDEYLAKPVTADELRAKIEGFTRPAE